MSDIHPTALIEDGAILGDGVEVGPYSVVGSGVELGDGVRLLSHVVVAGNTKVGEGSIIYPFASIGHAPQDLKYAGEDSRLEIGARATIREHVTMNPGTKGGGMITRVGDDCVFMAGAHVAHDCQIGDHVILINNVAAGGHCEIGDYVIMGGLSACHQFARIGKHAMVGGMTGIENDVIPFGSVMGNRAVLSGINTIGLKRRGFSRDQIHTLRNAYRLLFAYEGTLQERLNDVAELFSDSPDVMDIVHFIREGSSRAICMPRPGR